MHAYHQYKLYEYANRLTIDLTPLIPPEVNINGTSAESLVAQYREVIEAMRALDEAMGAATPHARDWQTMEGGDRLANICRAAWSQRRNLLALMREELEVYAVCIMEQQAVRRKKIDPLPTGNSDMEGA